ncbi:MAG: patatin-like phospholipase family protein [Candidatus Delongbacteria bacterium]|jgi:predicted acylesterase/phospholipase RssA|nr:patatin-like phospholipase family protein [Candidatus Delongbacteria bacterium]
MKNIIFNIMAKIITLVILFNLSFSFGEESSSYPKVGLALSGGGIRGIAHIGVLRRLEEENIDFEMISGSSMGSFIGGMFALGYDSYEIEKYFKDFAMKDLINNNPKRDNTKNYLKRISDRTSIELDLTKDGIKLPNALNNGQGLLEELAMLVNSSPYYSSNFDNLKYKLRVVASDIQHAKKVVFKDGDLPTIIMGSISFPGFFRPVAYNGMKLLDGGLTDNIPSDVLEGCDVILTSNTTHDEDPKIGDYNFIQLLDRISLTMTDDRMKHNLKISDVVFSPNIKETSLDDIANIDSLIVLGYKSVDDQIDKINELLKDRKMIKVLKNNQPLVNYKIVGNTKFLAKDILNEIENLKSPDEAKISIISKYKKSGLFLVKVDLAVKDGFVEIKIDEGVVERINIVGNTKTSLSFIKDELSIKVGKILRNKDLTKSINALYGTDLFYNVSYRIDDLKNCVCISVEEKPYNVLRIGTHYQTDRGYLGLFELANKSMHGKRSEMYISLLYGEKFNRVEASYYNIFMTKSTLFYELLPYYQVEEKFMYEEHDVIDSSKFYDRRAGASINLGFQLFNNYQGIIIANAENLNIDKVVNNKLKTSIGFNITADNRDDPVVPTKGVYLSLNSSSEWMDNNADIKFHKMCGEVNFYSNLSSRLFYSFGIFAGTGDKLVPSYERYNIGGKVMMPGTYYQEYSALQYVRLKVDQNYLLYSDSILDFYYTLGYTFNGFWDDRLDELDFVDRDFMNSFYVGLLLNTVIGPAELGWGITTGNADIKTNSKFYLSIGYKL